MVPGERRERRWGAGPVLRGRSEETAISGSGRALPERAGLHWVRLLGMGLSVGWWRLCSVGGGGEGEGFVGRLGQGWQA